MVLVGFGFVGVISGLMHKITVSVVLEVIMIFVTCRRVLMKRMNTDHYYSLCDLTVSVILNVGFFLSVFLP